MKRDAFRRVKWWKSATGPVRAAMQNAINDICRQTLTALSETIQCEIFPALILNDGGINDWIRPCHERLSALALCPFFLLTPLFSSFPPLFLRFQPNPLLPSFPRPPHLLLPLLFFSPLSVPVRLTFSRGCCFLNKELLIELYSPAWARRATPARGSGGHARLFTFLCCFQKGGIFVPSK